MNFSTAPLQFCNLSLPLQSLFLKDMANHKSAEKRIRANEIKRVRNRYQHKTTRTVIKKLKATTVKSEAEALLKQVASMIDKLAKKNVIHKKKASNQKSKLTKLVNKIAK
jgi:small subunit ribosomal protein S20